MNEPVAWMTENGTIFDELPPISGGLIPLYTHPAKTPTLVLDGNRVYPTAKTLTDEEILIEAKYQPNLGYYLACEYDVLDFARAILRKAQE
jgi:hypothetical protein